MLTSLARRGCVLLAAAVIAITGMGSPLAVSAAPAAAPSTRSAGISSSPPSPDATEPRATAAGTTPRKHEQMSDGPTDAAGRARVGDTLLDSPAGATRFAYEWNGDEQVEVWSVNDGFDLGPYTFHSGSPIDFSISIGKYLGPVDGDGHPAPGHALFGTTVTITVDAWDVDTSCSAPPFDCRDFAPEIDALVLNGTAIGILGGAGDVSMPTPFEVASRFCWKSSDDGGSSARVG